MTKALVIVTSFMLCIAACMFTVIGKEAQLSTVTTPIETTVYTEPTTEPQSIPTETVIFETEPPTEPTEIATTETNPQITLDPEDIELLARVIYQEAGGNSYCDNCRRRVADVVLNRIEDDRFPNTMLNVLRQKGQYGNYYWTGVVWPDRAWYDIEKPAVERARRIANEVASGQHSELYGQNYIWQAEFIQGYDWIYCCGIYYGKG